MPTFAYSGRTRGGQTVSGERLADTMDAAVAALRREQVLVTRITPAKAKAEDRHEAEGGQDRQAGVGQEPGRVHPPVLGHDRRRPAARAVPRHPRQQEEDKNFAAVILQTRTDVEAGASLTDAMRKYPRPSIRSSRT